MREAQDAQYKDMILTLISIDRFYRFCINLRVYLKRECTMVKCL